MKSPDSEARVRPGEFELIALLAVWMPATHASRLDPQEALRIE